MSPEIGAMPITGSARGGEAGSRSSLGTPKSRLLLVVLLAAVVVAGCALRVASFVWNERLQGDVNLFALTARELLDGRGLRYPFVWSVSPAPDPSLTMPADQHPPLFPFTGAALAKVLGTRDTFLALKVLCELAGLGVMLLVTTAAWRRGRRVEALVAGGCVAVSPLMVDFSANGSPYMLAALIIVSASLVLWRWRSGSLAPFIAAGVLMGLGYGLHGTMVSVGVAVVLFLALTRPERWLRGLALSLVVAAIGASPYLIWNLRQSGNPSTRPP